MESTSQNYSETNKKRRRSKNQNKENCRAIAGSVADIYRFSLDEKWRQKSRNVLSVTNTKDLERAVYVRLKTIVKGGRNPSIAGQTSGNEIYESEKDVNKSQEGWSTPANSTQTSSSIWGSQTSLSLSLSSQVAEKNWLEISSQKYKETFRTYFQEESDLEPRKKKCRENRRDVEGLGWDWELGKCCEHNKELGKGDNVGVEWDYGKTKNVGKVSGIVGGEEDYEKIRVSGSVLERGYQSVGIGGELKNNENLGKANGNNGGYLKNVRKEWEFDDNLGNSHGNMEREEFGDMRGGGKRYGKLGGLVREREERLGTYKRFRRSLELAKRNIENDLF